MTAVAGRHLVVWRTFTDVSGVFIDAGGRMSPVFRFTDGNVFVSGIAAASDGSRALLAMFFLSGITTTMIDGNGKAAPAGSFTADNVDSIRAAWDGGGYALAWLDTKRSAHWLAWTDANGRPAARPLQFAPANLAPVLVETAPGVTLFMRTSDYRNAYARFGAGGKGIDNTAQPLPVGFNSEPVTAAAFDGRNYYVVTAYASLRGAATDLVSSLMPVPLAFNPPQVIAPEVAVGDHQSFVGWAGSGENASVVRFKEGAFREETPIHRFDMLVADGDGVAAVRPTRAELVDADGAFSSTLALPALPSPAFAQGTWATTRLPDGSFLAAMAWNANNNIDVWATTFDCTHVTGHRLFVPYLVHNSTGPITISGTAGVAVWADDRFRAWLARFDDGGIRLGTAIALDGWITFATMAVDGNGHALAMTYPNSGFNGKAALLLVDLRTMTIVHKTSARSWLGSQIVWTGEEYVIASSDLDVTRVSHDGALLGTTRLVTPYPPRDVRLASGPAGTLLVYTRLAPDIGAGTVYRPFIRELRPPRRRAASK